MLEAGEWKKFDIPSNDDFLIVISLIRANQNFCYHKNPQNHKQVFRACGRKKEGENVDQRV